MRQQLSTDRQVASCDGNHATRPLCFTPRVDVDTRTVPARERYDYWVASVSDRFVPLRTTIPSREGLQGRIRGAQVADVGVRRIAGTEHRFERRECDISRSGDRDVLSIVFLHRGATTVEQDGRVATLLPGDFLLYDSARPFDFSSHGPFDYSIAMLPKDLLAFGADDYRDLTVRPRAGGRGVEALVWRLVTSLSSWDTTSVGDHRAAGLERALVALVSALAPVGEPPSPREVLVDVARALVLQHLTDPRLSPATVAAECGISVSYLHRVFEPEETTVAAFIREERLLLAHERLADPGHRGESIAAIGRGCGFNDPAHFSRLVRQRFGVAPTELRRGGVLASGVVPV